MTRLIDADALTDDILKSAVMIDDRGIQTGYEIAIELIKRQPTIDAEPVRHGKWIKADSQQYFRKHYPCFTCSECGYRKDSQKKWNYCPQCGARIDKDGKTDRCG